MKSFGTILKEAREAKGLTPSQVAHDTHMLVQIVEEMEREDFHRIPAPIYGRGFVRLYAERVGLDPAPLITEFMEIYQGRKPPQAPIAVAQPPSPAPTPAVAPQPSMPEPPPAPVTPSVQAPAPEASQVMPPASSEMPAPIAEPPSPSIPSSPANDNIEQPHEEGKTVIEQTNDIPPAVRGLDLFDHNAAPAMPPPAPAPQQSAAPSPAPVQQQPQWESPFASAYEEPTAGGNGENAAQRFRAGISAVSSGVIGRVSRIPARAWRFALLGIAAIALVSLAIWGCFALYKATEVPESPDVVLPQPAVNPAPPATAAKPIAAKTEQVKATPSKPTRAENKPSDKTPAKKASSVDPASLKSTGLKIDPLYID